MEFRVEIMPKANDDMEVAYHWLKAETSVSYASAWYLGLESAILALSESPLRFPVAQEFQTKKVDVEVRQCLYGNKRSAYRILFQVDKQRAIVRVLRVYHSSRRPLRIEDLNLN